MGLKILYADLSRKLSMLNTVTNRMRSYLWCKHKGLHELPHRLATV